MSAQQNPSTAASLVSTDRDDDRWAGYTEEERRNLETILTLRSVSFAERRKFMAEGFRHHRWGMANLADLSGMRDGSGYDANSVAGRIDGIEDIVAKGDRVWAVWTLRGTHSGQLFGIPATGAQLEVLEIGVWRLQDGLVAEAWFFADELGLLRQLGVDPTTQYASWPGPDASA